MREFLIFAGKRSHDGKKIYGQIVLVGNEYVILPFHVFDRDGHHVVYESTDAPMFFEQDSFEVAKIASDAFTSFVVSHTYDFNEDSTGYFEGDKFIEFNSLDFKPLFKESNDDKN